MPECDVCGETGTTSWTNKKHPKTLIPVAMPFHKCRKCGLHLCHYCASSKKSEFYIGWIKKTCPRCGAKMS
jgi:hypothetical protein